MKKSGAVRKAAKGKPSAASSPRSSAGSKSAGRPAAERRRAIPAATLADPDFLAHVLRHTILSLVRREGPDLSARQLAVFLISYLEDGPHTVRGLAERLEVSKPAITRALDRLGELDLARRRPDPRDRRSVVIQRTPRGRTFLRDLKAILADSLEAAHEALRAAAREQDA